MKTENNETKCISAVPLECWVRTETNCRHIKYPPKHSKISSVRCSEGHCSPDDICGPFCKSECQYYASPNAKLRGSEAVPLERRVGRHLTTERDMEDILARLANSSSNESSHELQCRCFDAAEEISRLRALFDSVQFSARDALRYIWLRERDVNAINTGGLFVGMTPDNIVLNGDDLDIAIDAAMTPNVEVSGRPHLDTIKDK